jgi:hypothetical protein
MKIEVCFILLTATYVARQCTKRIAVFHNSASNIYYIFDRDMCRSTIKRKEVLRFHGNNGNAKAPKYYVICTLPNFCITSVSLLIHLALVL